jgi:hypothetical protein
LQGIWSLDRDLSQIPAWTINATLLNALCARNDLALTARPADRAVNMLVLHRGFHAVLEVAQAFVAAVLRSGASRVFGAGNGAVSEAGSLQLTVAASRSVDGALREAIACTRNDSPVAIVGRTNFAIRQSREGTSQNEQGSEKMHVGLACE